MGNPVLMCVCTGMYEKHWRVQSTNVHEVHIHAYPWQFPLEPPTVRNRFCTFVRIRAHLCTSVYIVYVKQC